MRPTVLIAAAMIAVSAPALAQEAGAPGATGVGGSLTGSNPGSGYGYGPGYGYDNEPGPYAEFGPAPGYDYDEPALIEGRAAAQPHWGDRADHAPETVRGGQNGQSENW